LHFTLSLKNQQIKALT